jgi:hypothetical protein
LEATACPTRIGRKQRHTAKRIFERLRDEHGYAGGYTIVRDYVRLRKVSQREMFVALARPAGDAQADFGEAMVVIGGMDRKAHYLAMDLPQSDDRFVMAFPAETTEALLEGHNHAFAYFGGVPPTILYDNTKIAVARILGDGTRMNSEIRMEGFVDAANGPPTLAETLESTLRCETELLNLTLNFREDNLEAIECDLNALIEMLDDLIWSSPSPTVLRMRCGRPARTESRPGEASSSPGLDAFGLAPAPGQYRSDDTFSDVTERQRHLVKSGFRAERKRITRSCQMRLRGPPRRTKRLRTLRRGLRLRWWLEFVWRYF